MPDYASDGYSIGHTPEHSPDPWVSVIDTLPEVVSGLSAAARLFHPNGSFELYKASGNTDSARGSAILAARDAAASGDSIWVGPGGYSVTQSLAKNGVNWDFVPGARVTSSAGVFDDGNTSMAFRVRGQGDFIATGATATIKTQNAASDIVIEANLIQQTSTASDIARAGVWQINGSLKVKANSIRAVNPGVYWDGGPGYVWAQEITCTGEQGVGVYSLFPPADAHWYVTANKIESALAAAVTIAGNAEARVWLTAQRIVSALGGAVTVGGPKAYVHCQKLECTSGADVACLQISGGTLYLKADKISGGNISDALGIIRMDSGASFVTIGEIDDVGMAGTAAVKITGGSHVLNLGQMVRATAGDGVSISGGTLRMSGILNTAASNTSNPISKSGGTLILDAGTTLVANAARDSITAGSAQSVKNYGSVANRAINGNITLQVGTVANGSFVVDTNVV